MFFSYLDELSIAGECAAEYLALYQKLIKPAHWKVYLAARGVLPYIGNLITKVSSETVETTGLECKDVSFPLTQTCVVFFRKLLIFSLLKKPH